MLLHNYITLNYKPERHQLKQHVPKAISTLHRRTADDTEHLQKMLCAQFHDTNLRPTALCIRLPYWTVPSKPDNKTANYGHYVRYAHR